MKFQVDSYYRVARTTTVHDEDIVGMVVVCRNIDGEGQVTGSVVYAPVNSTYAAGHFKIMFGGPCSLIWANLVWVKLSEEESTLYRMS